jgi:hypothetical protein
VSIVLSLRVIGVAGGIASPFIGLNGQDTVSGIVLLVVIFPA